MVFGYNSDKGLLNEEKRSSTADLESVITQHTNNYDLYIARSNPSAHNAEEGHQLRQELHWEQVFLLVLGWL